MSRTPRRSIATAVLLLVLVVATARLLLEMTQALRHPAGPGYDDLLLALAAWVLLGCAAWAMAIVVAAVVETTSSGRFRATAWVGCPPSLRRLLLTGLGVALVGAGPVQPPASGSAGTPLPVPARPVGSVHNDKLIVHHGDTLWQLAADRLRSSASPGDVATLVADLHQRNRKVIGPDPDLIRPGQRLAVPPRASSSEPGRS
jgi:hypothetical protein